MILRKQKIQRRMNRIFIDQMKTRLMEPELLNTPEYVRSLILYQISSFPDIKLNYKELLDGYEWMRPILRKDDRTLDIANISALFNHSKSITFNLSKRIGGRFKPYELTDDEWDMVWRDLDCIQQMGLSMEIRFEISNNTNRQEETIRRPSIARKRSRRHEKWKMVHQGNIIAFKPVLTQSQTVKQLQTFRERINTLCELLELTLNLNGM